MAHLLILADIHQKIDAADRLLEIGLKETPDRIVFLGDLFDDFYDTPAEAAATARWFSARQTEHGDRLVALYGNHDLPYAEVARFVERHGDLPADYRPGHFCSGFSLEKARAILDAVGPDFFKNWKLHHREDGLLYSHAGADAAQELTLDTEAPRALAGLGGGGPPHPLFARGGPPRSRPGILWRDLAEFADDARVTQAFGHTSADHTVRFTQRSVCLDTNATVCARIRDGRTLHLDSAAGHPVELRRLPFDERYAESCRRHHNTCVRRSDTPAPVLGRAASLVHPF